MFQRYNLSGHLLLYRFRSRCLYQLPFECGGASRWSVQRRSISLYHQYEPTSHPGFTFVGQRDCFHIDILNRIIVHVYLQSYALHVGLPWSSSQDPETNQPVWNALFSSRDRGARQLFVIPHSVEPGRRR
jgi:hypothetical protein